MRRFLRDLALFVGLQAAIFLGLLAWGRLRSNEYLAATFDKGRRLATAPSPRLVFVGGSNLAFGLDSAALRRQLHRHPVNMGLNAALGLEYMLNEAAAGVRPGDVVVLSLEYEYFFSAAHLLGQARGGLPHLFAVNPAGMRHCGLGSLRRTFADAEGLRYLSEVLHRALGPDVVSPPYARDQFNRYGDLRLPRERPPEVPPPRWGCVGPDPAVRERATALVRDFILRCRRRGAQVYRVMPALPRSDYQANAEALRALERHLAEALPAPVLLSGDEECLPDDCFFDTPYHLNTKGTRLRTALVADRLARALGQDGHASR